MSIREFADYLGVSARMISNWEAGRRSVSPRPVNQAALDTALNEASAEEQYRFAQLVESDPRVGW